MKLSIGMIVKNESKYIERCLESLKPIMKKVKSELIIVDTGSEDNTVDIAKKYTDKVYFHKWNNDFAEARNVTVRYSKGEWFFFIDADEIVENPEGIINFLNSKSRKNYNSAAVTIKNITNESDDNSYAICIALRLFRNDKDFHFKGAVHEQPQFKEPVCQINTTLIHYGYLSTDDELMERKFIRNVGLLKKELERNPDNIYNWYQLSVSYGMYKDYKNALKYALKAYTIAKRKAIDLTKRMYVYINLATLYFLNDMYKETEKICKEALALKKGYIDLYYYLGQSQKMLEKNTEAIQTFSLYLNWLDKYKKNQGIKDNAVAHYTLGKEDEVYAQLCLLYDKIGEYRKVIEIKDKIRSINLKSQNFSSIIRAFINLNKFSNIRDFYMKEIKGQAEVLINKFLIDLEENIRKLDEKQQIEIYELFSKEDDEYSLLNKIRLTMSAQDLVISEDILVKLEKLDFNILPDFFGEIIYYLFKCKVDAIEILKNIKETRLMSFLEYNYRQYRDLIKLVVEYLINNENVTNLSEIRIYKALLKFCLISGKLNMDEYNKMFNKYVSYGKSYIKKVYQEDIIVNEMIYDVKNEEEAFLIYLILADKMKAKNEIEYVRCLKKALKVYPQMKKGIEILLEEVKNKTSKTDIYNKEFELYKVQVKENIKGFINSGKLKEAKELISKYEEIIHDDVEIYSMKAVIAMMENRLDIAEKILEEGLALDNNNCDLLYNEAYLYKLKGNNEKAIRLYQRVLELTDNEELKKEIKNELLDCKHEVKFETNDIQRESNFSNNSAKEEFEKYKRQLKDNINELIEQRKLKDAKLLIEEYQKIVPNDLEILLYKSKIALIES